MAANKILYWSNIEKWIFGILILSFLIIKFGGFLPAYTKWILLLLVIPSLFFLFRKGERINIKKLLVVIFVTIICGIIWDNVAIKLNIWNFPKASVSGWFLGIPFEEYIFAVTYPIFVIGFYTSLPKFRYPLIWKRSELSDTPLLIIIFTLSMMVFFYILFGNPTSYIKWLLLFTIIPSMIYWFRRGEKIDEVRMLITVAAAALFTIPYDYIFTLSGSWYHNNAALLGRIGMAPIDDVLFTIFTSCAIIGLYTSLPRKKMLNGKW